MVTVHLDIKKDCFFAEFSNLGLTNVPITDDYPEKYDRLLCGGIWCIVQLKYEPDQLNNREKWLLLARMLPLVENNFNLCELVGSFNLIFYSSAEDAVFKALGVE